MTTATQTPLAQAPLAQNPVTETKCRTISDADVKRFFIGKHVTGCAVCGHYEWRVESDLKDIPCHRVSGPSEGQLDIVVTVCQNCGIIGLYDRAILGKWLDCHSR